MVEGVKLFLAAWTLKNIQIKLIHILGGYTKDEYKTVFIKAREEDVKHGFKLGIKYLAIQLEHIAVQNYGCSKQNWIDKIYSKIQDALEGKVE